MRDRPGRPPSTALLLATLLVAALASCSLAGTHPARRVVPPRERPPAGRRAVAGARGNPAADPIVASNRLRGSTSWRIPAAPATTEIDGYADRTSVLPGERFRLFVSTTARVWSVAAYRMGWYGGLQGRMRWHSGRHRGVTQPPPELTALRSVEAAWQPSLTVSTARWVPGDYLLVLRTPTGAEHYVPIVVRSPSVAGRVVLLNAVLTWQAYNAWGGYDLYTGPLGYADRSYAVSFDRPYDGNGAVKFLAFEQPVVAEAERLGVPVAYETAEDVAAHPGLLTGAAAVVSLGHDEYWTEDERAAVVAARDGGTNVAFLGANAVYWRVRLAATPLGPDRLVVDYKDARLDPAAAIGAGDVTERFRDASPPEPEDTLTGLRYECFPAAASYDVYRPDFWLFAGTRASAAESLPGLVGPEIDRAYPVPMTRPIEVVAHSPVTCAGVATYADSAYYAAPSGAAVFDTGTMRWVCALAGRCRSHGVDRATVSFVRTVTDNVLRAFASPMAGAAHPAVGDLATLGEPAVSGGG